MNRAMQLEAALRSFFLHGVDAGRVDLTVIWKATEENLARQYRQLIEEYKLLHSVSFMHEANFRRDLLELLAEKAGLSPGDFHGYRRALRTGRLAEFLGKRYLNLLSDRFVLFLVDDNLFVRSFNLAEASGALNQTSQALGFSLRLGLNTTHCYTMNRTQRLPEFTPIAPGIMSFDWTDAELDFHYPLEISSSIYRMHEVLPLLNRLRFRNPNQLESRMSMHRRDFICTHPYLLCFERSVSFTNPVNRVQQVEENRAGKSAANSTNALAEKFSEGKRIDVPSYSGFVSKSCHQEVELQFIDREQVSRAN